MASKLRYFLFHKPYKILSQFSDEGTNRGFGGLVDLPRDVYPVGRLDLDSEGLLIMTNDRNLNHKLLDPSYGHRRMYLAQVDGEVTREACNLLERGVGIRLKTGNYRTLPAEVAHINPAEVQLPDRSVPVNQSKYPNTSWLKIVLREGKNRQVRKMTAKVGFPTLRLVRIAIEDLQLGDLSPGDLRMISRNAIYRKLRIPT